MKQILMSKEEYDQLMQDIENLKREKENLVEKNFDKDKEIENLKMVLEKVKHNHSNYLNQITTKTPVLDVAKFNKKTQEIAQSYFSKTFSDNEKIIYFEKDEYQKIMNFLKSINLSYINEFITYEENVSYKWGLNTELLNGTLLNSKIEESNNLRFKIYELEQERDSLLKQIKERDYSFRRKNDKITELNLQILELGQKANKYDALCKTHNALSDEMESYTKEMMLLKQKIEQYENERHCCIKLPEWAMRLLRRKQ